MHSKEVSFLYNEETQIERSKAFIGHQCSRDSEYRRLLAERGNEYFQVNLLFWLNQQNCQKWKEDREFFHKSN